MKIFITGGAGFIGCNCAEHFMRNGNEVVVFDNLSRPGSELNLQWLKSLGKFDFIKEDIRNSSILSHYFQNNKNIDVVIHLAGQTAVTTSIINPREDFEINALGTLNLLEAIRLSHNDPVIIYASTNKVYGNLENLRIRLNGKKYELVDYPKGISEEFPLDFHSPYGCSKGTADQYVRDFHRIYGLKTVVFRQSCIYGPRQFGVEDQGWVAWFAVATELGHPITIFGDGCQVRDLLHINDLLSAYELVIRNPQKAAGDIFNIGGGPENRFSVKEFLNILFSEIGMKPKSLSYGEWRMGDQKVFFSDIRKLKAVLHWRTQLPLEKGVFQMVSWIGENRVTIKNLLFAVKPL